MKFGIMAYRFGILGFLFSYGVLIEDPLKSYLAQHHEALTTYILLYGFPVLVGFTLLSMTEENFRGPHAIIARLINSLSAVTVFWLLLWCVIWFGMAGKAGNQNDPFVRYITFIALLGPAIGAACYGWAWKMATLAKRTVWFLIAIGWNISFMAFLNLHLDPTMGHLKGPGFGGLLVIGGVSLILQEL